ncbi:hypothetical protein FVF58_11270 [Paraburkholderia panacisoli]|uniref:Uncharacterized protein n=1 Tax=Paraburkholderia panacisoli TaxID=2603818 RepID=A0A5B0HBC2_9BURK|nr:hypothetical protein [Paraburkholderia panacisoli]KAA1012461.1 hypothetical protein FVF58_11270 [Paraburkholderia panacisoli]
MSEIVRPGLNSAIFVITRVAGSTRHATTLPPAPQTRLSGAFDLHRTLPSSRQCQPNRIWRPLYQAKRLPQHSEGIRAAIYRFLREIRTAPYATRIFAYQLFSLSTYF